MQQPSSGVWKCRTIDWSNIVWNLDVITILPLKPHRIHVCVCVAFLLWTYGRSEPKKLFQEYHVTMEYCVIVQLWFIHMTIGKSPVSCIIAVKRIIISSLQNCFKKLDTQFIENSPFCDYSYVPFSQREWNYWPLELEEFSFVVISGEQMLYKKVTLNLIEWIEINP